MSEILTNSQIALIVSRVRSGDNSARGELISVTQPRLFKFCLLLCRKKEQAEDICQETLIKALQNIEKLNNPETFLGWMYQIARNLYIDHQRSISNKENISEEALMSICADSDLHLIINVQKVLSHFDPDERVLLLLIELEGYSYREAAEIIGNTEDAVRSKLHRLRSLFIKRFNSNGVD